MEMKKNGWEESLLVWTAIYAADEKYCSGSCYSGRWKAVLLCSGDDGPPWSGVWNLTGKVVLDGDDYFELRPWYGCQFCYRLHLFEVVNARYQRSGQVSVLTGYVSVNGHKTWHQSEGIAPRGDGVPLEQTKTRYHGKTQRGYGWLLSYYSLRLQFPAQVCSIWDGNHILKRILGGY